MPVAVVNAEPESATLAYHRRILTTSTSTDRRMRAAKAIARLTAPPPAPARPTGDRRRAVTRMPPPRPVAKAPAASEEQRRQESEIGAHILAALKDGPLRWPQIKARLPLAYGQAGKIVIGQLQRSGRVIMVGAEGSGNRYRLRTPAEEARIPPVRTIAPPPTSAIDDAVLFGELARVLASGASYDVAELVRNIRGRFPAIDAEQLRPHLEAFAAAGRIERITLGTIVRYRRADARQEIA